jgi:hypothetical protein
MKPWQQVDIKPVTVELDTSLARQLANDEPKCANCKHWAAPQGAPRGMCALKPHSWDKTGWSALHVLYTTDLSVCSKWAGK